MAGGRHIASRGDAAPGTEPGVVFQDFQQPVINARGQVAFLAELEGIGVTGRNDIALYAESADGVLTLIARVGDQIDFDHPFLSTQTIETIAFTGGSGNEDGRSSGFNDRGQITFALELNQAVTGVFVSDLVAIPEPSSGLLSLLCSSLFLYRLRQIS